MSIGKIICIPFAWLLRLFYNLTSSYGVALIFFTVAIKVILLPFQMKSKKSMVRMNRLQPRVNEIQAKYANNQQKANEELQKLYVEEGVNPMSGCLWTLIPFPILIALYSIIRQPITRFMLLSTEKLAEIAAHAESLGYVANVTGRNASFYSEIWLTQFISEHFDQFSQFVPDGLFNVRYSFLGLDLTLIPSSVVKQFFTGGWPVIGAVLIPIVSAALSLFQSWLSMRSSGQGKDGKRSNMTMMLMMPLMSLYIGYTLPTALGIYWVANSVTQIVQDNILDKHYKKSFEREETERERQKREDRLRRMEEARALQAQRDAEPKKSEKKQPVKKPEKKGNATTENGRVGDRPYARGRSYSPEHYGE